MPSRAVSGVVTFALVAAAVVGVPTAARAATPTGAVASIELTPASATIDAGGKQPYEVDAYDKHHNFLGDVTKQSTLKITDGTCSKKACTSTIAGDQTVSAKYKGHSATAQLTVQPGALDHLTVSPASMQMLAGEAQQYTVEGFDAYGNDKGNLTGASTLTISPDGSCGSTTCTATIAGAHTVTATVGAYSATASLKILPGPIETLSFTSGPGSITAGEFADYTVDGVDGYGNDVGDITAASTFTISPDGSCTDNSCFATVAGPHVVTASYGSATMSTDVDVTPAAIDYLALSPNYATILAGTSQDFTAAAYDVYGNEVSDVTGQAQFSVTHGTCTPGTCTSTKAGTQTVTATWSGYSATATLRVVANTLDHLVLTPAYKSIGTGGLQRYHATGYDQYGNSYGDVTSATTFTIDPDGTCVKAKCGSDTAGLHTVRGFDDGATGTATLQINPPARPLSG